MSLEQKAISSAWFSILGNAGLVIVKAIAGFLGNSYALIADAIESTTDIFASVLVLFGIKYASRPADKNHPFGHGRIEPLITFLVVGFLIFSAIIIAFTSIRNIRTPHAPPESWTLYILGAIIIWKEFSFRKVMKKGKETGITSLQADAWHHRTDAITSIAAFIGISISLFFGKGYESADDWAALFASGFILYNGYRIFRPALGELMDEHFYDDLIADIRRISLKVEGVAGTEKCFVRKAGLGYQVDLHAMVDGDLSVTQGHEIAHQLQDKILEELPQIAYVLIHIEPA